MRAILFLILLAFCSASRFYVRDELSTLTTSRYGDMVVGINDLFAYSKDAALGAPWLYNSWAGAGSSLDVVDEPINISGKRYIAYTGINLLATPYRNCFVDLDCGSIFHTSKCYQFERDASNASATRLSTEYAGICLPNYAGRPDVYWELFNGASHTQEVMSASLPQPHNGKTYEDIAIDFFASYSSLLAYGNHSSVTFNAANVDVLTPAAGFEHWVHADNVEMFVGTVPGVYNVEDGYFGYPQIMDTYIEDIYTPAYRHNSTYYEPLIISPGTRPIVECQNGGVPNFLFDSSSVRNLATPVNFGNSNYRNYISEFVLGTSTTFRYTVWDTVARLTTYASAGPTYHNATAVVLANHYHYPYDVVDPNNDIYEWIRIREGIKLNENATANVLYGKFYQGIRTFPVGAVTSTSRYFADVVPQYFTDNQYCICRMGYFGAYCQYDIAAAGNCGGVNVRNATGDFNSSALCNGRGTCIWNGVFDYGTSSVGTAYLLSNSSCTSCFGSAPYANTTGNACQGTCSGQCSLLLNHAACINIGNRTDTDMRCKCLSGYVAQNGSLADANFTNLGQECWTCVDEIGANNPTCSGRGSCPLLDFVNKPPSYSRQCYNCEAGYVGRVCQIPTTMNLSCGAVAQKINVSCTYMGTGSGGDTDYRYTCGISQTLSTMTTPSESYDMVRTCTSMQLGVPGTASVYTGDDACYQIYTQCEQQYLLQNNDEQLCPIPFRPVAGITANNSSFFCNPPLPRMYIRARLYTVYVFGWLTRYAPDQFRFKSTAANMALGNIDCVTVNANWNIYVSQGELFWVEIIDTCFPNAN